MTVPAPDGLVSLAAAVQRLAASGIEVHDVGLEHPTLEEVFAGLTGEPADGAAHDRAAHDRAAGDTGRLETAAS